MRDVQVAGEERERGRRREQSVEVKGALMDLPHLIVCTFLLLRVKRIEALSVAHITYITMEILTTGGGVDAWSKEQHGDEEKRRK